MVLIAVLWIVAALAVIVTGLSRTVRSEAQVASIERQSAVAQAAGEAAIQLVLQQMLVLSTPPANLTTIATSYRSQAIAVEVLPLSGLIDINNAPPGLLAALYSIAGGMRADAAAALAAATVEIRSAKDARGKNIGFEAASDLLRVPGFGYSLYARLSPLVTADAQGSGRVNPLAAPLDVLVVLAHGNVARAQGIAAKRASGQIGIDTTSLDPDFIDNSAGRRFRLRARVGLSGGGWLVAEQSVILGGSARDGLPWHTFQNVRRVEEASARGG